MVPQCKRCQTLYGNCIFRFPADGAYAWRNAALFETWHILVILYIAFIFQQSGVFYSAWDSHYSYMQYGGRAGTQASSHIECEVCSDIFNT